MLGVKANNILWPELQWAKIKLSDIAYRIKNDNKNSANICTTFSFVPLFTIFLVGIYGIDIKPICYWGSAKSWSGQPFDIAIWAGQRRFGVQIIKSWTSQHLNKWFYPILSPDLHSVRYSVWLTAPSNSQFERKRWKVYIKKMGIIQETLNAAIRCVNNRISEYHEDPPSSLKG